MRFSGASVTPGNRLQSCVRLGTFRAWDPEFPAESQGGRGPRSLRAAALGAQAGALARGDKPVLHAGRRGARRPRRPGG